MIVGSELLTHRLHIATLAEVDENIYDYESVHLPLTIQLAQNF